MAFPLSPKKIAALLNCPERNVIDNWPLIENALDSLNMADDAVKIAALATCALETGRRFQPIHELGGDRYFTQIYDGRKDLGNILPGDGARFHGRGFIQITGRANYKHYGDELGVDLLTNPDAALEPVTSAAIFAIYFRRQGVDLVAMDGNWVRVRKLVNGGLNGYEQFLAYVHLLLNATTTPVVKRK